MTIGVSRPRSSSSLDSSASFFTRLASAGVIAGLAFSLQACSTANGQTEGKGGTGQSSSATGASATGASAVAAAAPIDVTATPVVQQAITRTLRVTGSLMADEQAEVSAETAGRIVKTPVERGSQVAAGALLVQIAAEQTSAQLDEAEANAARIAAGLALQTGKPFEAERVPNVANAKAEMTLAEADFARFQSLLDQRVVSQAEFDQRRTRVEAARQQYEASRNAAQQEYRGLEAARARVALARKSVGDTTVRAPFAGVVVERKVSVGDFVTTGVQVATVARINPLRVLLTVPEQSVGLVQVGQPVAFQVDAYPNRTFTGTVRYVSPSLRADQRALTVEALVANPSGELKPGFFATAHIEQPAKEQALLLDRRAIREVGGTKRIFVVSGDTVQERIVTLGQVADPLVEVVTGVKSGEQVALGGTALVDGAKVRVRAASAPTTSAGPLALTTPAAPAAPVGHAAARK
jgi:RND family efflux transporter MFP subunit